MDIYKCLNYELRYITPDEFKLDFFDRFPHYNKVFRYSLPKFIQLALLHPQACEFKAEEIFYGAVVTTIKKADIKMNDSKKITLLAMTNCWEKAVLISEMIQKQIEKGDDEPDN